MPVEQGDPAGRRRRWWARPPHLLRLRPCYKVAPRALSDSAISVSKPWPAESSGGGGGGGDAEAAAAERRDGLSPLPSKTARAPLRRLSPLPSKTARGASLRTCGSLTAWQVLAADVEREVADAEAAAAAVEAAVGAAADATACSEAAGGSAVAPALRAVVPSLRCRASQIDPCHIAVPDDVEDDGAGEDVCPHLRRTSSILRPADAADLAATLQSLGGSSASDGLSCGVRSMPACGEGEGRELGG